MRPLTVDRNDRLGSSRSKSSRPLKGLAAKGRLSRRTKPKKVSRRKSEPSFGAAASLVKLGNASAQFTNMLWQTAKPGKAKTVRGTARRKPAPSWRKPALIGGGVILAALMIGGISNFLSEQQVAEQTSRWVDEQQKALAGAFGLTVQEISIVGRHRASAQDILRALDVKRGDSILDVDPIEARARLETLGWVETASVMRRFPDELFIHIQERRPFARWQLNGKTGVIDRSGALVSRRQADKFGHLPKVVGDGANIHAAELFDMLSQTPTLFTQLQNAIRIRDRRWNLEFDNKVTVLLPENGAQKAWKQLYKMQEEKKILNGGLVSVDLRGNDRTYVRLKPKAAALRRTKGDKT
ncbi:MAG: hypothetical protein COB93_07080 [Sneathiella sp.]|nr:MAG: hypothetical protein COB93_07080 [Sneathiella sp.]